MGKVEQNHGDYFLKIQDIFWDRAMHFLNNTKAVEVGCEDLKL